ncbi:CGNR zinc finger domain-containing protein [Geomicrobium sp. JCM 19039]|uniref:CGNR zinc finger domain-containing protein n=1 Tax=Geomicrobium sp. JCM 19039 TaxID=1460636 RepID=UPI00045F3228|nr:CGNR zinc finger domain-containing protein [Geomicrobium sp. JCM 19039]GAK13119.1 hypothetical protein JCM19039_2938 [Geomicrobium sp. JCM 19039]
MDKQLFTLGGKAWINLINTNYIADNQEFDILFQPSSALHWLDENVLLRPSDVQALGNQELFDQLIVKLTLLRDLSRLVLRDLKIEGKVSLAVVDSLQAFTKEIRQGLKINLEAEKLVLVSEGVTTIDHVLYTLFQSIFETLDNVAISRIRNCDHPECRLHFVDTSKAGKRRWCSMDLCGNRQKAADFYARNKKARDSAH